MNLDLKIGSIYWVRIARLEKSEDGRTLVPNQEISLRLEPARYTGYSGGSPPKHTWDFLGLASAEEMAIVTEVGSEIHRSQEELDSESLAEAERNTAHLRPPYRSDAS